MLGKDEVVEDLVVDDLPAVASGFLGVPESCLIKVRTSLVGSSPTEVCPRILNRTSPVMWGLQFRLVGGTVLVERPVVVCPAGFE